MILYKAFRNKKFGEPFDPKEKYQWPKDKAPVKEQLRDPILGDLEDINDLDMLSEYPSPIKERQGDIETKLAALEKYFGGGSTEKRKPNEDLDTVREELDDEDALPTARDFGDMLAEDEQVTAERLEQKKKDKVAAFMHGVIVRRRQQKKQEMAPIVQKFMKGLIAYRDVHKERRDQLEIKLIIALKFRITKAAPSELQRMNDAVIRIDQGIVKRMQRKKDAKALREKLKPLPYVCRAGFIKMHELKKNTNLLQTEMKTMFKF